MGLAVVAAAIWVAAGGSDAAVEKGTPEAAVAPCEARTSIPMPIAATAMAAALGSLRKRRRPPKRPLGPRPDCEPPSRPLAAERRKAFIRWGL